MKSIIIGGDSAIGRTLAIALASRGSLVCSTTRRATPVNSNAVQLDLASFDAKEVQLPEGDVAFFCAAITGFAACRANETLARQVNVTGPASLARRLVTAGTRVVLLSTSAVFDWRVPHVQASHPLCPVTVYGKLKAEAEKVFSAFSAAASILRLTKVLTPTDGLFNSWIDALSRKQPVTAFSDHHMAPVTLNDAVSALLAISASSESGVFQVSGTHDISYYDAALHLVSRLGVNPRLVVKAQASETRTPADEIIKFSSMDTSRICALTGWKAPDAYSVMDEVFRERFGAVGAGSSAGRP